MRGRVPGVPTLSLSVYSMRLMKVCVLNKNGFIQKRIRKKVSLDPALAEGTRGESTGEREREKWGKGCNQQRAETSQLRSAVRHIVSFP